MRSLGGNCLIGYKVSINGFEKLADDENNKVYLIMSAIGDAVLLEEQKTPVNGPASSVVSEDILGEMTGSRDDTDGDKKDEIELIERELKKACAIGNNQEPQKRNARTKSTIDLRLKKVKS